MDRERQTLSYHPNRTTRPWLRTRVVVAFCALIVAGAATRQWVFPLFRAPNAHLRYADDVGAVPALYEIRDAVRAYSAANSDALPQRLADVKPFLGPRTSRRSVTAEELLPHVSLVVTGGNAPPIAVGPGRFLLMVYLRGAGAMDYDITYAVGEQGENYQERYSDAVIAEAFGAQQLSQLKRSGYQLP